jgi:UDP-N-acetylmuramate-alanine ligase
MKHIYFSGIGGAGLGPLSQIAQDAGYSVSGSDLNESLFTKQLEKRGIDIVFEQTKENIEAENLTNPIDWLVYSSALSSKHPELVYAKENGIKISKRDEFLNEFLQGQSLQLIAVAGTHGKTTTTGLLIWAFEQLDIPISYSIGTTINFGPSGKYDPKSKYFIYEADEYDRNFLQFSPEIAVLPSVDYDHADIYKTVDEYKDAFHQFISQSEKTIMFKKTEDYLAPINADYTAYDHTTTIKEISLPGQVRRDDAYLVKQALLQIDDFDENEINKILSEYPGSGRRFEKLAPGLITDYAHHPTEVKATIEMGLEINPNLVVVYEPHQNERQLQLIDQYKDIFKGIKKLYWLPTYSPPGDREKHAEILQPKDFISKLDNTTAEPAEMNNKLWKTIEAHIAGGDLVIAMSAGNTDQWLRGKVNE